MAQRAVQFDGLNFRNNTPPANPRDGDEYFDDRYGVWMRYAAVRSRWEASRETTKPYVIHVSVALGDDSNDGLLVTTAVKTFDRAMSLIPPVINHNLVLALAAETYTEQLKIYNRKVATSVTLSVQGSNNAQYLQFSSMDRFDDFINRFNSTTPIGLGSARGNFLRYPALNEARAIIEEGANYVKTIKTNFFDSLSFFSLSNPLEVSYPGTRIKVGDGTLSSIEIKSSNSIDFQHLEVGATTSEILNAAFACVQIIDGFSIGFKNCWFRGGHAVIAEHFDDGMSVLMDSCVVAEPVFPTVISNSKVKIRGTYFMEPANSNVFDYIQASDKSIVDLSCVDMACAPTMRHGIRGDTNSIIRWTGRIKDTGGHAIELISSQLVIPNIELHNCHIRNCGSTFDGSGIHAMNGSSVEINIASDIPCNQFFDPLADFVAAGVSDGDTITISNDTAPISRNGAYTVSVLGVKAPNLLMVIHDPPAVDSFPGNESQAGVCDYTVGSYVATGRYVGTGPTSLIISGCGRASSGLGDGITLQSGSSMSCLQVGSGIGIFPKNQRFGILAEGNSSAHIDVVTLQNLAGNVKNVYIPGEDNFSVESNTVASGAYTVVEIDNFCKRGLIRQVKIEGLSYSAGFPGDANFDIRVYRNAGLTLEVIKKYGWNFKVFNDPSVYMFQNADIPQSKKIYFRLKNNSAVATKFKIDVAIERID